MDVVPGMVWEAQRLLGVWTAFFHFPSLCPSPHSQENSTLYTSFTPKGPKTQQVQHIYQVGTSMGKSLKPHSLLLFLCFHVCGYFSCTYVCAPLACLVPAPGQGRVWSIFMYRLDDNRA